MSFLSPRMNEVGALVRRVGRGCAQMNENISSHLASSVALLFRQEGGNSGWGKGTRRLSDSPHSGIYTSVHGDTDGHWEVWRGSNSLDVRIEKA